MKTGKHYISGFSLFLDSWLYTSTSTPCLSYLKIPVLYVPSGCQAQGMHQNCFWSIFWKVWAIDNVGWGLNLCFEKPLI